MRLTPAVKALLIINIIFYVSGMLMHNLNQPMVLGAYYPDSPNFHIWQVVTYMFVHGGLSHIFFNMFALVSFGALLEDRWGSRKFVIFYFVTGIGALLMQWGVQAYELYHYTGSIHLPQPVLNMFDRGLAPANLSDKAVYYMANLASTPMVGASGAIFGLLIAFGMLYPDVSLYLFFIPVPVKAKYLVPVYMLLEVALGVWQLNGDSVAHFAHVGGGLIGFILVKLWKDKNRFYDYYG